jgi:hypothetical protein
VQVLRLLVKLYEAAPEPDWASICQCLMFLDDGPEVAKIFDRLLRGSEARDSPREALARCCILSMQSTVPRACNMLGLLFNAPSAAAICAAESYGCVTVHRQGLAASCFWRRGTDCGLCAVRRRMRYWHTR